MVDPMTAISIGSSVAGLFGKKKQKQGAVTQEQKPYFRPMNESLGDVDKILDYTKKNKTYQAPMMRRVNAGDIDGAFTPKAIFEMQNYVDAEAANPKEPAIDLDKLGREYVENYGRVADLNPTYWSRLKQKNNFDYKQIAQSLLDTQNDPSKFNSTNDFLISQGLGYAPKGLPTGINMPKGGVVGYMK